MKKCKKIILLIIMFILLTTINVYANSESEITISSSDEIITSGKNIEITLSAQCEGGVEAIDAVVKYDKTKLKLIDENDIAGDKYMSLSGVDEATDEFKISVLYSGEDNAPINAEFAKISFEVLDTAGESETLSVQLTDIEIGDSDNNWIEPEDKEITFKVDQSSFPVIENNSGSNATMRNVLIVVVLILLVVIASRIIKRKR